MDLKSILFTAGGVVATCLFQWVRGKLKKKPLLADEERRLLQKFTDEITKVGR